MIQLFRFCTFCILMLAAASIHAQWQENGVPVAQVTGDEQDAEIISDGAGGSIIVWQTYYIYRDNPDVYAQHLDSEGYPLWQTGGVPVCTAAEGQYKPQIVSDGAGGAIIAWTDFRNSNADIYAQRIDPDGDPVWEVDGIAVCAVQDSFEWFRYSRISMVERPGGAILVWYDDRKGDHDIYAQNVDTSGTLLWTHDGITVAAEAGSQEEVRAVPDEEGGAIALWIDWRSGTSDLYAQRITSDSTLMWAPGGVSVCTDPGEQRKYDMVADGSGGMICVWKHLIEGGTEEDADLYSQRFDADGMPVWATGGIPVCTAPDAQLWPRLATDGDGGAFYTWADRRDAIWSEHAVYVQHISADGDSLWPAGGISIREYGGGWDNLVPMIASDCFGGAIVAWCTGEPLPLSGSAGTSPPLTVDIEAIYAQRVAGDGTIWWQDGGVPLCDDPGYTAPRGQMILPDGTGGAVVTWYNLYAPTGIYAQRINGQGNTPPTGTGQNPPLPLSTGNYPNPFNPSTTITFDIPDAGHVEIRIYDIAGRLVRVLLNERREAGSHEAVWDGTDDSGSILASGVYFYNLAGSDQMRTHKMVLLR